MLMTLIPFNTSHITCSKNIQPLSPRLFSMRQFPQDIFPSGNFPNVQFPKRKLPKSSLAATLGPLAHPSSSAWPPLQLAAPQTA